MICISSLSMNLGSFHLRNIDFEVGDGECFTIIGPNGCGKTTLLECVAGLHKQSEGTIFIDNVNVNRHPPEKRGIGYVPQDYVLFPHLTTDQNVAFGLRNRNDKCLDEVKRVMRWLDIEYLIGRDTRILSAGERQKVALARALAVNPRVLLLDEPLSALDPLAREKLRRELKTILNEILSTLDLPVIYVTHDLSEAEVMSDQIAVMNCGKIEQMGSKDEVFENPLSRFVAEFLGYNTLDGRILSLKDGMNIVDVGGTLIQTEKSNIAQNNDVIVVLKPQNVYLSSKEEITKTKWHNCQCNVITGRVTEISKMGSMARIVVDAGIPLRSEMSVDLLEELGITLGSRVLRNSNPPKQNCFRSIRIDCDKYAHPSCPAFL